MRQDFSKTLEQIPPSGIRRFFDLVVGAKDVISLGVGEPDFITPWSVRSAAIDAIEQGRTSYTSNNGLLELRQAIVTYLQAQFQVQYNPVSEVIVTLGVSEAVDIVLRTILNPGDEVLLPEPAYVCYDPLIRLAGGQVVHLDTSATGFIPDPAVLEKHITPKTKAILLCSPSNPTGRIIPKETLEAIGRLAIKHDFWIIADEVYAELHYDLPFTSAAAIPGLREHVILLNGFSKGFAMTGWRLGFLAAPEPMVSRALKIHQYCMLCAPIMSQYAAIEALEHGLSDVQDMRKSYQGRRNLFVERLNAMGLATHLPEGAFYCFPSIQSTGLSSEEFALRLLQEERVAVVPGHVFGAGGEGHIRCCYASSLVQLKEALVRIERFLKKLKT
ncbi:MAG: aminotransferase class I/II-fold pyridoxal phosphate-dependent enzyme [Candidatus Margulisiibacteriota bacterium]